MSDKEKIYKHLEVLIQRYPELSSNKENIEKAYVLLEECYENGGKLLCNLHVTCVHFQTLS